MTRRGKRNYRSAGDVDNGVVQSTEGVAGGECTRKRCYRRYYRSASAFDNGAVESSMDVWSDWGYRRGVGKW